MNNQIPYMYNPQGLPNNYNQRPGGNINYLEKRIERLEKKVDKLESKISSVNFRDEDISYENDYSIYPPAVDNYMI